MRMHTSYGGRSGTRSAACGLTTAALLLALFPAGLAAQAARAPRAPAAPPQAPSAPPRQAAAPSDALPSARTVIERHVQAVGGRSAILAHTSTHASGLMSMPSSGVSGTVEVYAARPDRALVKLSIAGIGEVLEGFDGAHAWSVSAVTGPMLATGKELEQKKFDAAYDADLHDPARYRSMRTLEQAPWEGRPAYKISLVHPDGTEDIEYYDVQTHLKVATLATRESPMGPVQVTLTFADYRKFGDLLVPTTLKQSTMGVQQVLTFNTVEFDNVAPAVFEPPAQIKAMFR